MHILQIYKPKTIKNRQAKYLAGDLEVPDGKTDVKVLTCQGTASWSDVTTGKLYYYVSMDLNDDAYVGYKALS